MSGEAVARGRSECSTCEGHGERGIRQDYWGNWESETCPDCEGSGDRACGLCGLREAQPGHTACRSCA